jgi:hypothetical protein
VEVSTDDLVGCRICVGNPTGQLFHVERWVAPWIEGEKIIPPFDQGVGHETELRDRRIPALALAAGEIDGAAIQATRRAGFESFHSETKPLESLRNIGGRIPHPAALFVAEADVHQPAHESAGTQDHGATGDFHAERGRNAADVVSGNKEVGHVSLMDFHSRHCFEFAFQAELVGLLVALGAGSSD